MNDNQSQSVFDAGLSSWLEQPSDFWKDRFYELQEELTKLQFAVDDVYFAAVWHPDRPLPNETQLWTNLRDAAKIEPGLSTSLLLKPTNPHQDNGIHFFDNPTTMDQTSTEKTDFIADSLADAADLHATVHELEERVLELEQDVEGHREKIAKLTDKLLRLEIHTNLLATKLGQAEARLPPKPFWKP